MPYDVTRTGSNLLYFSDVKEIFRCAKCGTKLLFADACFSGTMKDSVKRNKKDEENKNNVNIAVMMSCANDEMSLELKSLGQGIFTYYLIEGLGGEANRDGNEYITIQELFYYIYENVKNKADEYKNPQHPQLFGKFDLRVIVAKVDMQKVEQMKMEKALKEEKESNITMMVIVYAAVTVLVIILIAIIKRNNKKKHENI